MSNNKLAVLDLFRKEKPPCKDDTVRILALLFAAEFVDSGDTGDEMDW